MGQTFSRSYSRRVMDWEVKAQEILDADKREGHVILSPSTAFLL